jgi:hypothetical protein
MPKISKEVLKNSRRRKWDLAALSEENTSASIVLRKLSLLHLTRSLNLTKKRRKTTVSSSKETSTRSVRDWFELKASHSGKNKDGRERIIKSLGCRSLYTH